MVFLERDIKSRKQAFGIEMYDILSSNSISTSSSSSAASVSSPCAEEIRAAFDRCRADIEALENKLHVKKTERDAIDAILAGGGGGATAGAAGGSSSSSGYVGSGSVGTTTMEDKETPGIPTTP